MIPVDPTFTVIVEALCLMDGAEERVRERRTTESSGRFGSQVAIARLVIDKLGIHDVVGRSSKIATRAGGVLLARLVIVGHRALADAQRLGRLLLRQTGTTEARDQLGPLSSWSRDARECADEVVLLLEGLA
jgi:hypothetical protein